MAICLTPGCTEPTVDTHRDDRWCMKHYGIFPHKCESSGCSRMVQYDDEPYCFTHSPDEGSSVRGYSAASRANV